MDPALLHAELDKLDALPVVKGPAKLDPKFHGGTHHDQNKKQPCVALNEKTSSDPSAVPNYLVAAEKLRLRIEAEHAGCLAAAEAARAKSGAAAPHPAEGMCASVSHSHAAFAPSEAMPSRTRTSALACARLAALVPPLTPLSNAFTPSFHVVCPSASGSAAGTSSHGDPNVLEAMMRMSALTARAEGINKASLELEQQKDTLAKEIEEMRRVMDPKRARTEAPEEETDGPVESTGEWQLPDHRREMTRVMNRRDVEIGSRESAPAPRTGKQGYLHHTRLGLVGAVGYWAGGSVAIAVTMVVALIVHLKIVERVRAELPKSEADKVAETEHEICNLLEQGFAETKHCRNEQQRQEYGIGLAFCAPPRDSSMIARIATRLGVHWGTRSKKDGQEKGRPFAFDAAIDRRAKFRADVALQSVELKPGDTVLSHGDLCELTRIVWPSQPPLALGCVLTFRDVESGAEEEKNLGWWSCRGQARPGLCWTVRRTAQCVTSASAAGPSCNS